MRGFAWFLLAILGAAIFGAPEPTSAAEPDLAAALAPDVFMLSKDKAKVKAQGASPIPMELSADADLRSSGAHSSANVSAPDPLWLRKDTGRGQDDNAPASPLAVAAPLEPPPPSKTDAAIIDALVSWAERQNSAEKSDKDDAASGDEVVVFELGAPSRRPQARPVDPVLTALPKSPRDLRDQLARPPPAGLGRIETAEAKAKPSLPDPSLLELVSLADKAYIKQDIGLAILPLAPLDSTAPDDARDTIDTITLGDLVSRANYHSEDVRADREGERSSRLAATGTLSQLGPRFDARFSKGHEHSFTSVGATPIERPSHVRTDGSAVIIQPLFDPVSIAGVARDQQIARGAQSRRRSTEVNVSFEAVTNYFDLLAARLALDLALKHQTQMNKLLDYMAKRAQLGGASEADFERVRAVTLSAKRAVIDAKGELDAALSAMQRISGVTAVQIAAPDKLYLDIPEDADVAFVQMVRRNPELKSAFLQIKAAHEDAVAAAARAAPKINLEMGRYQSQNASGAHGTTVDSRLMIVGSISLGAGTEAFQALSQSAHVSELKHRYASALRAAKERLRTAYLSRQNISDQRAVAWQEFASNTKVADAFDEQLFSANRSLIDVLDTYQKFYQSKLNIVRISIAQIKLGYQIKQIIGDLSSDNTGDEVADVASVGSR
jgi:outer membrane protein TolC